VQQSLAMPAIEKSWDSAQAEQEESIGLVWWEIGICFIYPWLQATND
jgi:hypothetical protein